ncbi:class II glutamine amidotransferase [Ruminococcus sp. YE282]|uniref:class II glutamine amidotransferase n=1 Tax=Ruminococcus sp. YE282 TaxID=3158780 RepID=UPI000891E21B|nr:class II glutamine amidotransferase [Ruminococcus bromii]MEE3497731.1 class II glutamine amidotransferase [Ruminococcus bromii]SCY49584.1 glutamine amidotransferase [Ruminococcus bromii]
MCELYGFSAHNNQIINENLRTFYSHSNMHPHGWGLAYLFDDEICIEKEAIQATKSHYLSDLLSLPIKTSVALAHIRFATVGNIYRKNCHPYSKRDNYQRRWTFIHNGTIFDYKPLNKYIEIQHGETDSERILLYLIDKINDAQTKLKRHLTFEERFSLIDTIIVDMSKGNKLNLIFFDGEYMYVHTNCKNSLHFYQNSSSITFSTQPLNRHNWENVKFTTLLVVKDGEFVAEGTNHGNEYIEDEDAYKSLFLNFSNL